MAEMAPRVFWVDPGRLLAGCYPTSGADLDRLREAGVAAVVDLTEDGELPAYALPDGVAYVRRPIADFGSPSREELVATLDAIDAALELGPVYVHCRGGCGRTGTVVACWLVRHGATPEEALERYRTVSAGSCPETDEQLARVRGWQPSL
jgi:protein-tyrosine phosphatase